MIFRRIPILAVAALAATSAPASEGGGGGSVLITPQIGLIFWTLVTFLLLLFVLGRFAWKPLLGAIEARERSIQETIDNAKSEHEAAARLLEEHKTLVDQARRDRADAMAAGQRDAERIKSDILEEGRKQREQLLRQAEAQIQAEMGQARSELRGIAADLSIRVAERLLARDLDDNAQRKLVEEYLDEIERAPDSSSSMPS